VTATSHTLHATHFHTKLFVPRTKFGKQYANN